MQINSSQTATRAVLALMVAAALSSCGQPDAAQGGAPANMPASVAFVTLQGQDTTLSKELPARVAALTVADIRPQVTGLVQKRLFAEGSQVQAGQLLYQLNPDSYQAAHDTAAAALAKAEAAEVAAQQKARRYAELVKIPAISAQDEEDARATLQQARATTQAARADLNTARINLAHTRITAPVSGRIGKSQVTEGALVTANQTTALATVQQLSTVYVDMTQSSTELLRLRRDFASGKLQDGAANVQLVLEDGSVYPQQGKLAFSDVTVDSSTGMVLLRATVPNPQGELLPGMFVRARLTQGVRRNAILVPQAAVSRNQKGEPTVLLVGADGNAQLRVIRTSQTVGSNWLVDDGLKAGERVIVEGLQKAQDGKPVKAAPLAAGKPAASAAG
jgi:membrane fusion protein (multidrug efflux system)